MLASQTIKSCHPDVYGQPVCFLLPIKPPDLALYPQLRTLPFFQDSNTSKGIIFMNLNPELSLFGKEGEGHL